MRYLIIGNGVAGTYAAANIRKADPHGEIEIITDEPYPFYSRIRLIDFLTGEMDPAELTIKKPDWYAENSIGLSTATKAVDIDRNAKEVVTEAGKRIAYDKLLLAAGGHSFVPPIDGADKKGVFTLRNLDDATAILDYAKNHRRVLMIGGGLLGLESANSLRRGGCEVMVAEFFQRLLPRQMDAEGARILQRQLEAMGFTFYLGVKSKQITGADVADGLLLEDGRWIECDMIVVSAGVRPNLLLPEKLGLKIDRAVPVNDKMETECPDVYAAGDIAEHGGICYGIWPASQRQGMTAGINMAGGHELYKGTSPSNTLKVAGVDLFAAGDIDADGHCNAIVASDTERFSYKKIVLKDNRIVGAILYGDTSIKMKLMKAVERKAEVGPILDDLKMWNLEKL